MSQHFSQARIVCDILYGNLINSPVDIPKWIHYVRPIVVECIISVHLYCSRPFLSKYQEFLYTVGLCVSASLELSVLFHCAVLGLLHKLCLGNFCKCVCYLWIRKAMQSRVDFETLKVWRIVSITVFFSSLFYLFLRSPEVTLSSGPIGTIRDRDVCGNCFQKAASHQIHEDIWPVFLAAK